MTATRRTLLAGIAAPVLGSGLAAALAAPSGSTRPGLDAELLALIAAVPALAERSLVLGREHDRIEEACCDRAGPVPEKPRCHPSAFPDFRDFDRAMDAWQVELVAAPLAEAFATAGDGATAPTDEVEIASPE